MAVLPSVRSFTPFVLRGELNPKNLNHDWNGFTQRRNGSFVSKFC
jgi:hypothetical protein